MKLIRILATSLAILAFDGPALAANSTSDAKAVWRGLMLAKRNCAACHAIGAKGASTHADAPPFRTLHMRYPAEALDEAFRRGLLFRHPSMPQFRFLPGEIADLTAYMRSLRARGGAEARSGVVQRAGFAMNGPTAPTHNSGSASEP